MYLENISVIGYIGNEPTSNVVNGKTVCNFSVAATNPRTKKATWYRIAAWGGLGDTCLKFIAKGKPVYVEGSFEIKDWQKQGTPDKSLEIQARNVQFLSPSQDSKQAIEPPVKQGYGNQTMYGDEEGVPF